MSDAGAGGLALDDVMLRLADDRAAVAAALGLRRQRLGGVAKHLRGDRLGLGEGIAARRINGSPPIRRRLLLLDIHGAAAWLVTSGELSGLTGRSRAFVRVVRRLQNRHIFRVQSRVRFLVFNSLPVMAKLFRFLLQGRDGRTAEGSRGENGSADQVLLAD